MAPLSDPRRVGHSAPYQRDTSSATLVALILVIAVPALVVALAAGWRPLSGAEADSLVAWLGRLTGGGGTAVVAAPTNDWAIPTDGFTLRSKARRRTRAAMP